MRHAKRQYLLAPIATGPAARSTGSAIRGLAYGLHAQ